MAPKVIPHRIGKKRLGVVFVITLQTLSDQEILPRKESFIVSCCFVAVVRFYERYGLHCFCSIVFRAFIEVWANSYGNRPVSHPKILVRFIFCN